MAIIDKQQYEGTPPLTFPNFIPFKYWRLNVFHYFLTSMHSIWCSKIYWRIHFNFTGLRES
jgi:hypothetical protein